MKPPRSPSLRFLLRLLCVVLYLRFVVGYAFAFLDTPLTPSSRGLGQPEVTRWDLGRTLVEQIILWPGDLLAKWFGAPGEFGLADRLPVLLVAALIVGWATAAGWLLMRRVRADRGLTRLECFVFSAAVGLNAVSTYVLAVGLLGWLRNPLVFAVPAALTLAAAGWIRWRRSPVTPTDGRASGARRKQKAKVPQTAAAEVPDRGGELLGLRWLWLAAPMAVMILLGGMLPPLDFDVREYHLQVPKEFYQQGRIGFLPHNVYGNMPLGSEMHSLLAMVVTDDWWLGAIVGKTIVASMTLLAALALLAAGARFFSRSAGVVAAVVYLSIPWVVSVSSQGLIDGVSALYLLLAVYAVLLATSRDGAQPAGYGNGRLLLAGYLAGGAVATKYPAVVFVLLPMAAWIVIHHWLDRHRSHVERFQWRPVRRLLVFLMAASLGCGLWFGKNWALTGNPTYPLLYSVFGGKNRTAEKDRQWTAVHRPTDFSLTALRSDLAQVAWRSEWLSPLVVPLAVLAWLDRRHWRLVVGLAAYFAAVIAAWWLLTHRIDRFWIPALPVLALLAGAGACWSRRIWWRRVLVAVLVMGLAANLLVADAIGYSRYCVRLELLRRDPARVDPWHHYFNTHVGRGRVLMVGDAQVFDVEPPVLYNTCFDDSLFEQLARDPVSGAIRPAGEVRAALAARGVTYVYVAWGELDRYRRTYGFAGHADPEQFEQFVRTEIDRLAREGVLEPLPAIEGHPGRGYRVRTGGQTSDAVLSVLARTH